jgi:hypothetical protein
MIYKLNWVEYMMKLRLLRNRFHDLFTTGQLYLNDDYFCFTLEDKMREKEGVAIDKWKVYGQTAIPRGIYKVVFQNSPKFGVDSLALLKVPGFSHIYIHSGNTHEDTEGCIIVGYRITRDGVIVPGTTRPALRDLKKALKGHKEISIQVI